MDKPSLGCRKKGEIFIIQTEIRPLYNPLAIDPGGIIALTEQGQLYEVLQVALFCNLFERLETTTSAQQLTDEMGWEEETTVRLLNVLVKAGYLTFFQGSYQNTALASTYFLPEHFLYLGHKLDSEISPNLSSFGLLRCLQKNPDTHISKEPKWDAERLRQIGVNALTGAVQSTVNSCDLTDVQHLLDLGGGHGFYSIALAQKYPQLKITLFDLPQVIGLARQFITRFHMEGQINLLPGDFLQNDIGSGYDVILCSNILHSDKRNILLPKVKKALRPGGNIILKCRIADCPDTLSNALNKLFWQVHGGKELFTQAEWQEFLSDHGFYNSKIVNVEGMFATMIASS